MMSYIYQEYAIYSQIPTRAEREIWDSTLMASSIEFEQFELEYAENMARLREK